MNESAINLARCSEMRNKNYIVPIFISMSCSGCAIQPLPQDVVPLDTYDIVRQIRCEVRDALIFRVNKAISLRDVDRYLVPKLESGELSYKDLLSKIHDADLKGVLETYKLATVAYDFSLDMTETDNISGGVTLTRPLTRGSNIVGFNVASDHKRQNTRTFTINDTFFKLVAEVPSSYCAIAAKAPNYNYPITGKTRLGDTVISFLDLNQSADLGFKADNATKTPTLTDDLQFTTTYSGSISPAFSVTPVARLLTLSGVTGKAEGIRNDIHRVTIALALPVKGARLTKETAKETESSAFAALANASGNRTQIYIQKISNGLTTPANGSILSSILP